MKVRRLLFLIDHTKHSNETLMRELYFSFALLFLLAFDQAGYKNIYPYGDYQEHWAMVKQGRLYGFIDTSGTEVVAPTYRQIHYFGDYQKDWALVKKGKLYGFINTEGIEVVAPIYQRIDYFDEYRAGWAKVKKDGVYGFIDFQGLEKGF